VAYCEGNCLLVIAFRPQIPLARESLKNQIVYNDLCDETRKWRVQDMLEATNNNPHEKGPVTSKG